MSEDKWRFACPACGSRQLSKRTRKGGYRCGNGHVFPEEDRIDMTETEEAHV